MLVRRVELGPCEGKPTNFIPPSLHADEGLVQQETPDLVRDNLKHLVGFSPPGARLKVQVIPESRVHAGQTADQASSDCPCLAGPGPPPTLTPAPTPGYALCLRTRQRRLRPLGFKLVGPAIAPPVTTGRAGSTLKVKLHSVRQSPAAAGFLYWESLRDTGSCPIGPAMLQFLSPLILLLLEGSRRLRSPGGANPPARATSGPENRPTRPVYLRD